MKTETVTSHGLSGSALKLIAVITMLTDHVAAAMLGRMILAGMGDTGLYNVYLVMRQIGRIAFPIYIFLMIEGFEKTRSKARYALRMAVFALLSEIPFDLAFSAKGLEFSHQNIFFTLLIGMLAMMSLEVINKRNFNRAVQFLLFLLVFGGSMGLAELLRTDYGMKGIICIMAMYVFRKNRMHQIAAGSFAFLWEPAALFAFFPIASYNGERGWKLKYIFYIFYPLHLLIIYLICMAFGIHGYAVI